LHALDGTGGNYWHVPAGAAGEERWGKERRSLELVMSADLIPIHSVSPSATSGIAHPRRNLKLSQMEEKAATGLVTGDLDAMRAYAQAQASAYSTGDGEARRRGLARAAAVQEAQMQVLSASLAAAVARRDERAVLLLDRTLTSATTRYRGLLEQLRVEFAPTRRVFALAKGTIAIAAEEHP
jgi:hypothetical protein